jgi:8-oxo-dGTP pyrophosphatase MutT (NUDIX family)
VRQYLDQGYVAHRRPDDAPVRWRVGVYALVERDGRILMVDQIVAAGPGLTLPGGGVEVEREETVLEGSIREVYEETGYRLDPDPASLALIGDHFIRSPSGNHYHALSFLVRGTVSDAPDPAWRRDDTEIIEVRWADPADLTADDVRRLHWGVLVRLGLVAPDGGVA